MRRSLLLIACTTSLVVAAACSGGGGGSGDPSPSPSASPSLTATPSPSPSPSPTSPFGNLVAHVSCEGGGCFTGKLRTVVFDCVNSSVNLAVGSSGTVTLVDTTSVTVTFVDLPAPELDCLHGILDDTGGNTAVSNEDPMVTVMNGTSEDVTVIISNPAM